MRLKYLWLHWYPSLRGWVAFARAYPRSACSLLVRRVHFTVTRKDPKPWTDPFGFEITRALSLVSYWSIFIERDLDHPLWRHALPMADRPFVIDVGANVGIFTHYIHTLNPGARILAIEPQETMVDRIKEYAIRNQPDIECVAAACSSQEGTRELHLNQDGDTTASLEPVYIVPHGRSRPVSCRRLDQIVTDQDVFLLKIDAEGHDIEVLKGAKLMLKRTRYVLLELHDPSDLPIAKEILGEDWRHVRLGPIDFLFISGSEEVGETNEAVHPARSSTGEAPDRAGHRSSPGLSSSFGHPG